ncbi:PREDICTED: uncharacterized protein LOC106750785 [Dinoponera quadriceps]|uniref:Uncharacterized protein LOC106750785 n=1 Tax=Dinoponera quadriceps TaxID=609295 RepID=A0A6P3YA10_DINQU|nr:PREDICTED: uncharacterized protein LOC106750785 [Dinoponera quadriceps]
MLRRSMSVRQGSCQACLASFREQAIIRIWKSCEAPRNSHQILAGRTPGHQCLGYRKECKEEERRCAAQTYMEQHRLRRRLACLSQQGCMPRLRVVRRCELDRVARNDVTKRAFCPGSMLRQEVELPLTVRLDVTRLASIPLLNASPQAPTGMKTSKRFRSRITSTEQEFICVRSDIKCTTFIILKSSRQPDF